MRRNGKYARMLDEDRVRLQEIRAAVARCPHRAINEKGFCYDCGSIVVVPDSKRPAALRRAGRPPS